MQTNSKFFFHKKKEKNISICPLSLLCLSCSAVSATTVLEPVQADLERRWGYTLATTHTRMHKPATSHSHTDGQLLISQIFAFFLTLAGSQRARRGARQTHAGWPQFGVQPTTSCLCRMLLFLKAAIFSLAANFFFLSRANKTSLI